MRSISLTAANSSLDLGVGASAKDLTDAMLQFRAAGFTTFHVRNDDQGFHVSPTPRPVPPSGELVLVLEPHRWKGYLLSENGQVLEEVSGNPLKLSTELRPATHGWGGAPCQVTIALSADIPAARVTDAMSILKAHRDRCGTSASSFSILPHREAVQPSRLRRYVATEGARWTTIRVRAPSPPPEATNASAPATHEPPSAETPEGPPPNAPTILREARELTINGVRESWRIIWRSKPKPACTPQDSFVCPCRPFYYGERGYAELVRSRPGYPDEVLPLSRVFIGGGDWYGTPVLRRWPQYDGDYDVADRDALARSVRARPSVRLMEFRDYNNDGWAAEFMLPVDTTGCADLRAVVVGVTKGRNTLHAFSSVANPDRPLILQPGAWVALESAGDSTAATTVEFPCGFRGSGSHIDVVLKAVDGDIFAEHLTYACPKTGAPRSHSAF